MPIKPEKTMADNIDTPPNQRDTPGRASDLDASATPPPSSPARDRSSRWSNPAVQAGVALALIALIALIAIVGTVAMNATDTPDTTKTADTHPARTRTTIDNTSACKMELAGWLDLALAPGGSLTAAGAEYGLASPEYKAIETVWSKFGENLYVVGADNATTIAVESLDADCDTLGDSYIPGHIAPN